MTSKIITMIMTSKIITIIMEALCLVAMIAFMVFCLIAFALRVSLISALSGTNTLGRAVISLKRA